MNIMKIFVDVFVCGFETIIIYYFFDVLLIKSKFKKNILIIFYILFFICHSLKSIYFSENILMSLIISVISIFLISLFYKKSILIKFLFSLMIVVIFILSEMLIAMTMVKITGHNITEINSNILLMIQGIFIVKITVFILAKALKYFKLSKNSKIAKKLFLPMIASPISTIIIIYIITEYAYNVKETTPTILMIFAVFLLIVSNILMFYLLEKQLKLDEERQISMLIQQQLMYQSEYFKELSEKYKISNSSIHDTKNKLIAISAHLKEDNFILAKEKITELCGNIFNTVNISNTGNDAIDALINSKYQKMESLNIDFNQSFFINTENKFDDIELCIIIGNALDNAIEACEQIFEGKKEINLKIKQIEDNLYIEISNTKNGDVDFNGGTKTTKKQKHLHGFGLKSIQEIVNSYNGHMNIMDINGIIILKILLQNPS